MNVVAIINDSTGTLLKGAYLDADCAVGMIFGSGFNCCFIEQVSRIQKLTQEQRQKLSGQFISQTRVQNEDKFFQMKSGI